MKKACSPEFLIGEQRFAVIGFRGSYGTCKDRDSKKVGAKYSSPVCLTELLRIDVIFVISYHRQGVQSSPNLLHIFGSFVDTLLHHEAVDSSASHTFREKRKIYTTEIIRELR